MQDASHAQWRPANLVSTQHFMLLHFLGTLAAKFFFPGKKCRRYAPSPWHHTGTRRLSCPTLVLGSMRSKTHIPQAEVRVPGRAIQEIGPRHLPLPDGCAGSRGSGSGGPQPASATWPWGRQSTVNPQNGDSGWSWRQKDATPQPPSP